MLISLGLGKGFLFTDPGVGNRYVFSKCCRTSIYQGKLLNKGDNACLY